MKFKPFTKPGLLKEIGRHLFGQFFDRFKGDLAAENVQLPPQELEDDEYFKGVAGMLMAPEGLPAGK